MFPNEWTGREAIEWRGNKHSPSDLVAEKEKLAQNLKRCRSAEMGLCTMDHSDMSEEDWSEYEADLKRLSCETQRARELLSRFGETFDSRLGDSEAYERRVAVEEKIINAISKDALFLVAMHGQLSPSPWKDMLKHPDFELNFPLSYMRLPEDFGNERRSAGFVRHEFDAWAAPFELDSMKFRNDRLEDRVMDWFRFFQANEVRQNRNLKKAATRRSCADAFQGEHVGSLFDAAWALLAHPDLKKPGYRKS